MRAVYMQCVRAARGCAAGKGKDARAHPDFVIARRRRRRLTLMLSSALVLFGGAGGLLAATLVAVRFSDELLRLVP